MAASKSSGSSSYKEEKTTGSTTRPSDASGYGKTSLGSGGTSSTLRPNDASGYSRTSLGSTVPSTKPSTGSIARPSDASGYSRTSLGSTPIVNPWDTGGDSSGSSSAPTTTSNKSFGRSTDVNKWNEFVGLYESYYGTSKKLTDTYNDRFDRFKAGEYISDAVSLFDDMLYNTDFELNRDNVKDTLFGMSDWLYDNSEFFSEKDYSYLADNLKQDYEYVNAVYDSLNDQAFFYNSFADEDEYSAYSHTLNGDIGEYNDGIQKQLTEAHDYTESIRSALKDFDKEQSRIDVSQLGSYDAAKYTANVDKQRAELERELAAAEEEEKAISNKAKYAGQYAQHSIESDWYNSREEYGLSSNEIYSITEDNIAALTAKRDALVDDYNKLQYGFEYGSAGVDYNKRKEELSTEIAMFNTKLQEQQGHLVYASSMLGKYGIGAEEGMLRTEQADAEYMRQQHQYEWTYEQNLQYEEIKKMQGQEAADNWAEIVNAQQNVSTDFMRPTEQWTAEQKNAFYSLMSTDAEAARKFAVSTNQAINQQAKAEDTAAWREWGAGADDTALGKFGRGAAGLALNIASTPVHLGQWLDKMAEVNQHGDYVGKNGARIGDYASAIVEGRAEQLNIDYGTLDDKMKVIGGKGLGDIYQLVNSMAQSAVLGSLFAAAGAATAVAGSVVNPGEVGTLVAFFGQAADSAFDEAIARGVSGEQAAIYSFLAGAAEVAGEKFSLENLLDPTKRVTESALKRVLTQAGIEGSEEAMTDVFNLFNDALAARISGGTSDIQQQVFDLMSSGNMSYEDAQKTVWKQFASDVAWDAVGGFISGGGQTAMTGALSPITPYVNGELTAGNIVAEARANVTAAADKGDISKLSKVTKRAENRLDKGKNISVATARSLVKQTNRASMVDATEQQVKNRTELEQKDARSLANAVVAKVRGEQLTSRQLKLIDANKDIADTLTSELKDADKDWAMNIGVRGEDAKKYGTKKQAEWYRALNKVSDAMTVDVDGAKGTIMETVRGNDGKITGYKVQTANGISEVSADAANLNEAQQAVAHAMTESPYAAEMINSMKDGQNVAQYTKDFQMFAELYGFSNSESFDEAWKQFSSTERTLTEEQARAAWNAGKNSLGSLKSGLTRRGTGKTSFDSVQDGDTTYEAPTQEEQEEFMRSSRYSYLHAVARLAGVDIVFFKAGPTGINGKYENGTVYLAIDASPTASEMVQGYVMSTAAHELTHYIRQASPENYVKLKDFVVRHLIDKGKMRDGMTLEDLIQDKQENYLRHGVELSVGDALEEVVADACEMALRDNTLLFEMQKEEPGLHSLVKKWLKNFLNRIKNAFVGNWDASHIESENMEDVFNELQQLWTEGVVAASRAETSVSDEQQGKLSIKEIVGADGNTYGMGVYLDSNLLDNLTDDERIDMVKLYIEDELGGKVLTAFDEYGVSHDITIADKRRFTNKSGKRAKANSDLTHHTDVNIKQQAIANAEELILAASFVKQEDASHPHDWLDDNGNNKWDLWKVHIQEKNNTIWTASLRIANTTNGEKVLYDIGPIKKVEGGGTAPTQSTNNNILQGKKSVKQDVTQSMTMAQAKRMLDASFNALGIKKFGDYSTAEQWVREEGADSIALEIESDYDLYMRYISKLQGIVDDDYTVEDIIQAYIDGTLVGQEKAKAARLDVSHPTDFNDTRFYAPHNFSGDVPSLWQTATQRLSNSNREVVTEARRQLLFFAHSGMSLEAYGITASELNKKLKQWSNYTSKAIEVSNRINEGVPVANQWTGIQNCSILNKMSVTTEDIAQMVKEITGESNEHQRNYIGRALLALDTHIDWTGISFEFAKGYADPARKTVRGLFNKSDRKITIGSLSGSSTVAHEMGHALDNIWFREIFGNDKYSDYLSETTIKAERIEDPELQQFYKNYQIFIRSLADTADISSSYTQKNTETFARFVAKFVEWADIQAGNSFYAESNYFRDNFNASQYIEFARLLQEKAMIDAKSAERKAKKQQGKLSIKNSEYMDAVNSGDMDTAQRLVDEAALQWGATTDISGNPLMLYHGTQSFGFTKIETSKGDDGISFFATNSMPVATTYSGRFERTMIGNEKRPTRSLSSYREELTELGYTTTGFVDDILASDMAEQYADIIDSQTREELLSGKHGAFGIKRGEDYRQKELKFIPFEDGITIGSYDKSSGNYGLYADTEGFLDVDANGSDWNRISSEYGGTTRTIAKNAKDAGYNGVIIRNVYDTGYNWDDKVDSEDYDFASDVYIFFAPEAQTKSADPVTYDDAGDIIPLSQRFNSGKSDIRYSLKKTEARFNRDKNANGVFDHTELIELNNANDSEWTGKLLRRVYNMDDTEFEQFHSEIDKLTKNLLPVDEYETPQSIHKKFVITNAKGVEYQYDVELDGRMHGEVKGKTDLSMLSKYKARYGKNGRSNPNTLGRVKLSRQNLGRSKGNSSRAVGTGGSVGYGRMVGDSSRSNRTGDTKGKAQTNGSKSNIKKLSIKQDNALSDRELLANTLMSATQNDGEKRRLQNYKDQLEVFYKIEEDLQDAERVLTEAYHEGDEKRIAKAKKWRDELSAKLNRADSKLLEIQATKPLKDLMARVKQDTRNTTRQQIRERQSKTELRHKIKNLHESMTKELLKPTQNRYVPKDLIKSVADILELVNTDSGRSENITERINTLNTEYRELSEKNSIVYDDNVAEMVQKLAVGIKGKTIYDLNKTQLKNLYDTMKAIQHTVTTAVKMVGYETEKDAFQIAKGLMQETAATNPMQNELLNKWLNASMRPESFFKRLGGYRDGNWMMMYDMLDKAQLYQSQLQMEGSAIFAELMNDTENFNKMTDHKNLVDIGLKDKAGEAVLVTMDIALKIYMDTLAEDNARHLMYSGYTVPDMKTYYKGKASEAYGKGRREVQAFGEQMKDLDTQLRNAEDDITKATIQAEIDALDAEAANWIATIRDNIWNQMGDYEKSWVEAARKFFNGFSQDVLNKTTLEVYGFEKATVENYVPIHTDAAYRKANFESISRDMSIENMGFMKARITGATNPMLAEGLVDVVSMQIDKVAKYAAMMPAIRNFTKVYGKGSFGFTDSVQAEILKKFGTGATKYIENLMADLTGSRYVDGGMLGEYADKLRGNLAAASLTLNPRVALGQTASYPTAAAVVGWSALGKALKDVKENPMLKNNRETLDEIAKYSPLMWLRMQGYFDESVKDMRSSKTVQNKVSKKLGFLTNWIETMDGLTVGQLWFAAQYWVEDNTDLKRGTEEFMQKSAEMFNKIVEETQPDYTALQRPDILRNPNAVVKQMTMFMTQRLQNVNILFDAVGTYNQALKDNRVGKQTDDQLAEAKKSLTLAVSSQLAAAATITAFKLLADALMYSMKGYRDDDDELTKESIMDTFFTNCMESLASNFLWGAEIYDLATSLINKDTYYGVSLAGIDTFVDMTTAIVNAANSGDKAKWWKVVKNTCQVLGIPLTNMEKMYNAVRYRIEDAKNGEGWGSYASEIKWTDEQRGRKLYEALVRGDKDAAQKQYDYFGNKADANKQLYKYITGLYESGEISEEDAALALQKYADVSVYDSELAISKLKCEKETGIKYDDIKEQYLDGNISKDKAAEYRSTYGDIDLEDAEATVQQWTCEKETGYAYDSIRSYIESGDITEQEAVDLRVKYGGQEEDAAVKTVRKWMCEIETGIPYDKIEDYYAEGLLDKKTLTKYYMEYGLYDEEKANSVANKREFIGTDTSLEDASLAAVEGYWGYCEDLDVDKKLYLDTYKYCYQVRADKDSKGKSISGSALKKKLAYINTLALSSSQKTAVAKAIGITDKQLTKYKAAWLH